jgi:adenylate kinase family enzyme
MKRILVTGNAGSGKTTLSLKLGEHLGIPVAHLDRVVWGPGWKKNARPEVAKAIEGILSAPTWIVDGVSSQACQAADTVVFLDFGVPTCLFRGLKRTVRYFFGQRPEVPPNCPEVKALWLMVGIIFRFPGTTRLSLLESLERPAPDRNVIRVTRRSELKAFLDGFERKT